MRAHPGAAARPCPGELNPLLVRMHLGSPSGDDIAGNLQMEGVAFILRRYQLPPGRRYALLALRQAGQLGRAARVD